MDILLYFMPITIILFILQFFCLYQCHYYCQELITHLKRDQEEYQRANRPSSDYFIHYLFIKGFFFIKYILKNQQKLSRYTTEPEKVIFYVKFLCWSEGLLFLFLSLFLLLLECFSFVY